MSLVSGINGIMPRATINVDKTYQNYEQIRLTLRQSWSTSILNKNKGKAKLGPFRIVTNAGDLLNRQYYSCNNNCQSFQGRPGLFGLSGHFGGTKNNCDNSGIPAGTCNIKYVYDSSNYTTFLKQQATNRNYNDKSNGGSNNASQSALKAIHRF
jgi:hypothetical protein